MLRCNCPLELLARQIQLPGRLVRSGISGSRFEALDELLQVLLIITMPLLQIYMLLLQMGATAFRMLQSLARRLELNGGRPVAAGQALGVHPKPAQLVLQRCHEVI